MLTVEQIKTIAGQCGVHSRDFYEETELLEFARAIEEAARADAATDVVGVLERALEALELGVGHAGASVRNAHFEAGKQEYWADRQKIAASLCELRELRTALAHVDAHNTTSALIHA